MTSHISARAVLAGAALLFAASSATADDDEFFPPVTDPLTREECSACHMAYPASMLPRRSWRAIMDGLEDHFGEDASLDPQATAHIREWLQANAADSGGRRPWILRGLGADETPLRISELPKMVREHRGEVSRRQLQKAGSMSNCNACHVGAESGFFEDD